MLFFLQYSQAFCFPWGWLHWIQSFPCPMAMALWAALHTQHTLCPTPLPITCGVNLQYPQPTWLWWQYPVWASHAGVRQGVSTSPAFRGWCETPANHGCCYWSSLRSGSLRKRQKCPPDFLPMVLFIWSLICLGASLWDLTWQRSFILCCSFFIWRLQ